MMDINIINQTIGELEDADTTFFNCQNLASLYIVRDRLNQEKLDKELYDIIPTYKKYCEVKKKFQMNEVSENIVIDQLQRVCKETKEFINTLYCHSDTELERNVIKQLIEDLYTKQRG